MSLSSGSLDCIINSTEIQGPSTSVKSLGFQWCGAYHDNPSKIKDKLLHLVPPTTERGRKPSGSLRVLGGNIFFI